MEDADLVVLRKHIQELQEEIEVLVSCRTREKVAGGHAAETLYWEEEIEFVVVGD